jgi:GNAT superfamily N-acetyltransferase
VTVAIRRASAEDAAAVAAVFLDSFHATYAFPLAHTDEEVRGWIRDRLIPNDEVWVAIDADRVVGMMALAPGWLEQLYVAPDRLGEGIGRQLMALAKERQPGGLQLWTFQVNARARRFYASHGFVAVEETDDRNQERQPDVRYVWPGDSAGPLTVTLPDDD